MMFSFFAPFILLLPLIGFLFAGGFGKNYASQISYWVTTLCISGAFIISCICLDFAMQGEGFTSLIVPWLTVPVEGEIVLKAVLAVKVDTLTAVMMCLITFISGMIHIYSYFYMQHDPGTVRFISYMSLFTFFMLVLVSAADLIQLFLGWEGVGVASYLLIGFWFHKKSANAAALKAFLVNRIGDCALILGIAIVFFLFGTVNYDVLASKLSALSTPFFVEIQGMIAFACMLLFIGAMGKSAQLGLHIWLPDAMEGPTPVSALLHSATMVTAGVFLLVRLNPLFEISGDVLAFVVLVGTLTALFAGSVALAQNDIKRVIAYSTMSQLGFMFVAIGASAYALAIFHLVTHAFFKSLLFLGSGSVIHALNDEQDMKKMGGLAWKLPWTHALMLIGTLALIGVPMLSGAMSKDLILESIWAKSASSWVGYFGYYGCVLSVALTALYAWRLMTLTFYGKTRLDQNIFNAIHESPVAMLLPLIPLALASLGLGWFVKEWFVENNSDFWGNVLTVESLLEALDRVHHTPWVHYIVLSSLILGLLIGLFVFLRKTPVSSIFPVFLRDLLKNKGYFDEGYQRFLLAPIKRFGQLLWIIDLKGIDAFGPNGVAHVVGWLGQKVRLIQSGYLYRYALIMIGGLVCMLFLAFIFFGGRA